MTDNDWTSSMLWHLMPRSRERLALKHCRLGKVMVYPLSLSGKVVSSVELV
jgi:hypothetical protein